MRFALRSVSFLAFLAGSFVEIIDKKKVVLKDEDGKRKTVLLNQLSGEDIFNAVESELKRQSKGAPASPRSPFVDSPSGKQSNANTTSRELTSKVESRITEMIKVTESDASALSVLAAVFHPDHVRKLTAKKDDVKMFEADGRTELLTVLYQLDAARIQQTADGNVRFAGTRRVSLRMHNKKWYLVEQ